MTEHFQVGLCGARSDKKSICKLSGIFRVPIMGGFDRLFGIEEYIHKILIVVDSTGSINS